MNLITRCLTSIFVELCEGLMVNFKRNHGSKTNTVFCGSRQPPRSVTTDNNSIL